MELTGCVRDAVLDLIKQENKSGRRFQSPSERLQSLSEEERARAIRTIFTDGRLAKFMVLDGIAKGRLVPFRPKDNPIDTVPMLLAEFKKGIDGIISQKGETCCKIEAAVLIANAFYLGRQLIPIGVGGEEFREAELILRAARMRDARNGAAARRRAIISAHYGNRLEEKRPSPAQVIKACGDKFEKAGIECPKERTIRGDVAAILKELPEK